LAALRAARLVRISGAESPARLECHHDRVRESVAARLSADESRAWHRRLADAVRDSDEQAHAETLVWHYQQAGEEETAAQFAVTAGDRATELLAFDQAAACYRLALDGRRWDAREEQELRLKLAQALGRAGRGGEAANMYLTAAARAEPREAIKFRQEAGTHLLCGGRIDEAWNVLLPVFEAFRIQPPPVLTRWSLLRHLARQSRARWRSLRPLATRLTPPGADELQRIDLCMWVGGLFSYFDWFRGVELLTRANELALRSGDPTRIGISLCQQAAVLSHGSHRGRRLADRLLDRVERMAAENPRRDELAWFAASCRGMSGLSSGRWLTVRRALEAASKTSRRGAYYSDVAWNEVDFYLQWAFYYSGDLAALALHVYAKLPDALRRGDLFSATNLRSSHAAAVWLAADQPDEARRHLADAMRPWPTDRFTIQRYLALTAAAQIELYRGGGAAAWSMVEADWKPLRRSGVLGIRLLAIEAEDLRARAALAACTEKPGVARPLLHIAAQAIRRLHRQRLPWAAALAESLAASLAAARRKPRDAQEGYRRAFELFEQCDMALHAAAARRRWGELLGGEHGAAEVAAADRWMAEQTIREPRRMAEMLCPMSAEPSG
ncbi:MAG: hypothetical protein ACREJM_13515, partial [Candidatus Saccharimonadales bacterium]